MILVPEKFVYLAAPRTGSRTTCEALIKHCDGRKISKAHHASRAELEQLNYGGLEETDGSLPVYSMMRDPLDFILAAWSRSTCERLEDFVETWNPDSLGEWDGRITPYDGFVDHYFIFEDGLPSFFERVGFPGVPLGHKGRNETRTQKPISVEQTAMLMERFAVDFERYGSWLEANRVL